MGYPALPEDYIFTPLKSQKHLPTQLILSVDFITMEKKLLSMLWVIPASNEVFKLKHYHLNEFLEGKLSVFLFFICVFFNSSPVTHCLSSFEIFVTQSYKIALYFLCLCHSRNNGMKVKKFIQFGENCSHSRLLTQVSALCINLNENIKLAGWISSKELHLLQRIMKLYLITIIKSAIMVSIPMKDERCLSKSWGKGAEPLY